MTDKPAADSKQSTAERRVADQSAAIDQWFYETFHGSPLARDTEMYNTVHRGLPDLKKRLAAIG